MDELPLLTIDVVAKHRSLDQEASTGGLNVFVAGHLTFGMCCVCFCSLYGTEGALQLADHLNEHGPKLPTDVAEARIFSRCYKCK